MTVIGEAADAEEALAALERMSADAAIVDLKLPGRSGLDLIKAIRARFPETRALVVSAYPEELFAERALRAGALGYVSKRHGSAEVVEALRLLARGKRYVSEPLRRRLSGSLAAGDAADELAALSDREIEIFRLIGEGESTSAIAAKLHLSVHTIDSHRENIRYKLNLKSGAELTQRAVRWVLENGY